MLIFVTSATLMPGQAGAYESGSIIAEALACAGGGGFCIPRHVGFTCDLTRVLIYVWFGV